MFKLPVINVEPEINMSFDSLFDPDRPIYLDHNATTPVDPDAITAMIRTMEFDYGNPGAFHRSGQKAKQLVDEARLNVAEFMGCKFDEVVFVSSGTEGINAVINSVIKARPLGYHIITCQTEHNATLNKLKSLERDYKISYLSVDELGQFSLDDLAKALNVIPTANVLFSFMAANNETGSMPPNEWRDAINLAHKFGALVHIDAIQVAGKIDIKPYIQAGADYLTISGHKFGAPKGIGAVYVADKAPFSPITYGGNQEFGFRAGTENVPAIIGLGVVAKKLKDKSKDLLELDDLLWNMLRDMIPSIRRNGGGLPGVINIGFKYVHREAMVAKLSENGIFASVGSACASGIEPSHVLTAMGVPEEYLHGSVRFSLGRDTTKSEIHRAVKIITRVYEEVRSWSLGIIE